MVGGKCRRYWICLLITMNKDEIVKLIKEGKASEVGDYDIEYAFFKNQKKIVIPKCVEVECIKRVSGLPTLTLYKYLSDKYKI